LELTNHDLLGNSFLILFSKPDFLAFLGFSLIEGSGWALTLRGLVDDDGLQ